MSLPSPNGSTSTSSILSSEDSSSSALYSTIKHHIIATSPSHPPIFRQHLHQEVSSPAPVALPQKQQPSTSGTVTLNQGSSGARNKPIKLCRVCGDRAKSYHFGGISCDSCKAFFRRSVQNDAFRNFHCPYEGRCDISITSRKCCQYCRFHKCLSIGMEKSWVMTEEERLQLLKSRMEKRKRQESESHTKAQNKSGFFLGMGHEPDLNQLNNFLTLAEVKIIENLMNSYASCQREISFSEHTIKEIREQRRPRSRTEILDIFFTAIQQFALFAKRFESFVHIGHSDQEVLLRGGVLELCFIRGALVYNSQHKCWTDGTSKNFYLVCVNDISPMVSQSLLEKHLEFIKTVKKLYLDEVTMMLLSVVVLLTPDRTGLTDIELVANQQEKYLLLLKSYMDWRYGTAVSSTLYAKLLLKLPDLRELAEAHTDYHLLLCKDEQEEIQQRLSSLRIDVTGNCVKSDPIRRISSEDFYVPWTFARCLANPVDRNISIIVEEELSSSSEGSERILVSD